ncbi:enoyl-CoA hydratase-related protein [Myxococcota bacterium]|nr:enoyl-CoA hydratase-related protein [Myxococcota bacterium]
MISEDQTVSEERVGRVVVATLGRPEKLNAFRAQEYEQLCDLMERALEDDEVGAVLLTGTGRAFSAGADVSLLGGRAGAQAIGRAGETFDRLLDALASFEKPLLAAVNGLAVGFGATILLHFDMVYAAQSARLRFPFTALGLVPEAGSSYLLPLIVGTQRASELFLSSDWLSAGEALEIGLVRRVVPDAELREVSLARAAEIAARPVGALRASKRILLDQRSVGLRAALKREHEGMLARSGTDENLAALGRRD